DDICAITSPLFRDFLYEPSAPSGDTDHERIPQDHATRDRAGPDTWPRVKTREYTIGLQSLVILGEVFDLLVLQGEKLTALIKPARDVLSLQIHAIVLGRASRPGEEGPWRGDHSAGPGKTL